MSSIQPYNYHHLFRPRRDPMEFQITWPPFPEVWLGSLPPGTDHTNVDRNCLCYNHAPGLWTGRFDNNPQFSGNEPPVPIQNIPGSIAMRRSCDYRIPVALLEAHLQRLVEDGMTKAQRAEFAKFQVAYTHFQIYRHWKVSLPDLNALTKPINSIFFGGCLRNVKFRWADASDTATEVLGHCSWGMGNHPSTIVVFQDMFNSPGAELLSTLLHEMVHEFTHRFFCDGHDCHTESRSLLKDNVKYCNELCRHMHARFISLFYTAKYQGRKYEVGTRYWGHGSIFQRLVTALYAAVPKVLGGTYPVRLAGIPGEQVCRCRPWPGRCLGHCCDGWSSWRYYSMNQIMLQEHRRLHPPAR